MLSPLPDKPMSARRSSIRLTGVPFRASSAARTLEATVAGFHDGHGAGALGAAGAQDGVVDLRVDIGQQHGIQHAVAAPEEAFL
jgi:hypothetical protein